MSSEDDQHIKSLTECIAMTNMSRGVDEMLAVGKHPVATVPTGLATAVAFLIVQPDGAARVRYQL